MIKNPALILCVILSFVSCGNSRQSQTNTPLKTFKDIQDEVVSALLDTATAPEHLTDVMTQYGDYLLAAATDPDNIDLRLNAQGRSLFTIQLLIEKFAEMDSLGRSVSPAQMDSCLSRLMDASCTWGYANNDNGPMIYKEVFYNSYQDTEEPVPGYFQIIVYLPTEENPEPAVGIFYPQTAQSDPMIVFTKDEINGVPATGWDNQDYAYSNNLELKNANGDGAPMNDVFGPDFLEKMLNNEHMYLMFNSESPAPGVPGDREIARMELSYFHKMYYEVAK